MLLYARPAEMSIVFSKFFDKNFHAPKKPKRSPSEAGPAVSSAGPARLVSSQLPRLSRGKKPQHPPENLPPGDPLQGPAVGLQLGAVLLRPGSLAAGADAVALEDRKSTRLNSSTVSCPSRMPSSA